MRVEWLRRITPSSAPFQPTHLKGEGCRTTVCVDNRREWTLKALRSPLGTPGRKYQRRSLWLKEMVRPERFELPTFWFVVRFRTTGQTKPTNEVQQDAEEPPPPLAPFCLTRADIYGQNADNSVTPQARGFRFRSASSSDKLPHNFVRPN
jgi:hypothetical protein